jgi:serine phosphatase RsbU (regulator of sigma subunit)/anti-sigma regulatory factor (Ser/Thr protein kinase)
MENDLMCVAHALLVEAYQLYEKWGAHGKTRCMEKAYPFLAYKLPAKRSGRRRYLRLSSGDLSSGAIDLLAILRASQALSSETDLNRLRDRVVELLGKMTGATNVSLAVLQGEPHDFVFLPMYACENPGVSIEAATAQNLLPASAFRYALRNREPILVPDAPRDERFSEDPYFAGLSHCSLLVVPIFDRGALLAVLFLENRLSSAAFSEEHLDTVKLIAGQLAVSLHNTLLYASLSQAYEREKQIATTFQEAALDSNLPRVPGLALDAVYYPGHAETLVGGDWYDAFRLPDGRIVFSIGDVVGSGLHAAVTMGSIRQSIRTAALINPEPVAILDAVDRIVRAGNCDSFATAFVGVLDPLFFEFSYASAGHPPPLLKKRDGSILTMRQEEPPLGLRQHDTSSNVSMTLEAGSLLILYTDGLTEFERDTLLGEKKLFETVRGISKPCQSASELYHAFFGNHAQRDDVAILTISLERPLIDMREEGLVIQWEFDVNDADMAHAKHEAFVDMLEEAGLTITELSDAEVVFGELLGNVVRYAGGKVTILLDMSAEAPVLHVLDRGDGFEHNRRLPSDLMSERGRGLFLVNAFTEEANVSRRRGGGSHARAVLCGRIRHPSLKLVAH